VVDVEAVVAVEAKQLYLETAVAVVGEAVVANGIDMEFAVEVIPAVQQEMLGSLLSNGRSLHIGSIQRTGWEGEESCHELQSQQVDEHKYPDDRYPA